jgi:FkbM family methyltransferase
MIPNCQIIESMDAQFLVFSGNDLVSNALRNGGYELDLHAMSQRILSEYKDGVVLDIGANLGSYTIPLAKKHPDIKFHAFEPQRIVSYQLCANVIINSLENVYTYELALSNENTSIELTTPDYATEGNIGAFSIDEEVRANEYECATVNTTDRIDLIPLDHMTFNNIRLIKVDVEGHELEALKGGIETIKRNNYPPIIFEAWTWKPWYKDKRDALFEYLKGHGYNIIEIGENNIARHPDHEKTK